MGCSSSKNRNDVEGGDITGRPNNRHGHSHSKSPHDARPPLSASSSSSPSSVSPSQSKKKPKKKKSRSALPPSPSNGAATLCPSAPPTDSHSATTKSARFIDQIKKNTLYYSRIKKNGSVEEAYDLSNEVLGTGISGEVRIGTNKQSKNRFAVKSLPTQNISPKKASMLYNEISVYLQLDHPNIAKLFEVYEDDNAVHLIMELCTGKELYDRLATKKRYAEKDAAKVTQEMLSALAYCHSHRIVHRDLKLENWVYAHFRDDAPLKLVRS